MARIYNELRNYQNVPRELVFDKDLSDRARFVYVFMACKPDDWDFYLEPMAKDIGYSVDTLRKYINELVASGWLVKGEQTNEKGVFGAVEYTIKATKFTDTENYRHGKNKAQDNKDISSPNTKDTNIKEINKEEKEIDESISKKGNKFALDMSFVDETFMPIVLEWLEYKKEKRQSYKQRGFNAMYESLLKMSNNNPSVAKAIVEQSMQNNYAGLFPLKNNKRFDNLPTGMIIRETQEERNEKLKNEKGW